MVQDKDFAVFVGRLRARDRTAAYEFVEVYGPEILRLVGGRLSRLGLCRTLDPWDIAQQVFFRTSCSQRDHRSAVRLYPLSGRVSYKPRAASKSARVCGNTSTSGSLRKSWTRAATLARRIRAETGKMAQDLGQNLIGGQQANRPECPAERRNSGVESVARGDQRDPIEGVGEERSRPGPSLRPLRRSV